MASGDLTKSGGILGYFGLETGGKAVEVLAWAAPYLAVLAAGLAGISALVHYFLGFPVWVYALAGGLALVYFFLFLARMRKAAADAGASDAPPGPES